MSLLSHKRVLRGGWVNPADLPKGPTGRALCRWCQREVAHRRRTFCSAECVHEWKLRTNPGYVREQVLLRDKGICALCGVDCVSAWRRLQRLTKVRRAAELASLWGLHGNTRRSLWDVDHILPVTQGGGLCGLCNLRTLCVRCHRYVTEWQRSRQRQPV